MVGVTPEGIRRRGEAGVSGEWDGWWVGRGERVKGEK